MKIFTGGHDEDLGVIPCTKKKKRKSYPKRKRKKQEQNSLSNMVCTKTCYTTVKST